jgi:hypothetical protein
MELGTVPSHSILTPTNEIEFDCNDPRIQAAADLLIAALLALIEKQEAAEPEQSESENDAA